MGLLARFFKGGIIFNEKMKFRQDIKPWYDIYILQSTEEEIVHELLFDKDGNKRTLPHPNKIREKTLKRIEERKKENERFLTE